MSELDGTAFVRFLETFADRLHERRDELTQLDSAIGDADHGINMDRGFTAVRGKLAELDGADLGAGAKAVGMTLISTVGGASGPLYGTFFLRLATALGGRATVGADELGWHKPYEVGHDLEHHVEEWPAGGVLEWVVNTAASALVGLAVGLVVVAVVAKLPKRRQAATPH